MTDKIYIRKPSNRRYATLRQNLMEETWGHTICKCKTCGYPYINGHACKTCGATTTINNTLLDTVPIIIIGAVIITILALYGCKYYKIKNKEPLTGIPSIDYHIYPEAPVEMEME